MLQPDCLVIRQFDFLRSEATSFFTNGGIGSPVESYDLRYHVLGRVDHMTRGDLYYCINTYPRLEVPISYHRDFRVSHFCLQIMCREVSSGISFRK